MIDVFIKDTCWIYIIENSIPPRERRVVFCGDEDHLFLEEHLPQSEHLVYLRRFDNTFDALAHKLMLESLSYNTVSHVISQQKKSLIK